MDYTGMRFGKWTCIRFDHTDAHRNQYWVCKCDCGLEHPVQISNLISKKSSSCSKCKRHYIKHGQYRQSEYMSWINMRCRCDNPKNTHYADYGGRGITYDPRWSDFKNFFEDMGKCPDGYELDRVNNNGIYEKSNCRWTSRSINMRNQRKRSGSNNNYKGVFAITNAKPGGKQWYVKIAINYKQTYIGSYYTEEEGRDAYLNYIKEHNLI